MLEITGEHIKKLNDSDLRSLVGLLCEAELKSQGIPTAGVKWGGDQRAADGGIDVKVEVKTHLQKDGYIPKRITGFQVKTPNMPRSAIISEMKPNDELRESIKELVDLNGAYIIVSSNGSTSESALHERKQAMREALLDLKESKNLEIDFYDRTRLASWVRNHPSLILWVRKKIGNSLQGWKPYGNWSNSPGGIEEEYILDDQVRLFDEANRKESGLMGVQIINTLRSKLVQPQRSVRLAGLSGVGKTRLVQALFDDRIGDLPLNTTQVLYTDIGSNPLPSPQKMAGQIISMRTRVVLVIDNCSPEIHRQLSSICTSAQSLISLITIEYDVRDDQPEETEVFRLEPASTDLIEKMVGQRFKHVTQVDARTIAEFSGGNARIAIALSETIERDETLADLRNEELFNRLFHQRNKPDNQLLRSAEVCSLVYSFDSRTEEGINQEMKLLAEFAGTTLLELHRDIAELKRRQLVQQRNHWKAVLPHAIANRLAKRALENIPEEMILQALGKAGNERLLISFSRRLGYLHDSEIAIQIAEKWLSADGILGSIGTLNTRGIDLFKNIAPVKPEATLTAIERAANAEEGQYFTSRENKCYTDITRLLCSLAYDSELFERATNILLRFALSEREDENVNSIRAQVKSLFLIYLSGTHATAEQRLNVIRRLVASDSKTANQLGFDLLKSALQTSYFTSYSQFDFGARPRDTGFYPKNREEVLEWYGLFINYTVEIAITDHPPAEKARILLAEHFRGLWTTAKLYNELEKATEQIIAKKGSWKEGWVGIQKTIRFDKKDMNDELLTRLQSLGEKLKPSNLLDRARLYAFSQHGSSLELPDTINEEDVKKESDRYRLIGKAAQSIGEEVAQNKEVLSLIFPELVHTEGAYSFNFGQGLADGISDSGKLWKQFKINLAVTEESNRRFQALRGFLFQEYENNPEICDKLLDDAVKDNILGSVFPYLQAPIKSGDTGLKRLHLSLELGVAPIFMFKNLAYGRAHESFDDDGLSGLLKAIASKEGGTEVAVEILHMRFYGVRHEGNVPSEKLIYLGRELLENIELNGDLNIRSEDYILSEIVKVCYKGAGAEQAVQKFCNRLALAIMDYYSSAADYNSVCEALVQEHPKTFLDSFYGENNNYRTPIFFWNSEFRSHPLSKVDQDTIVEWCEENPSERYPKMASAVTSFKKKNDDEKYEWSELAIQMMNNAPEPEKVLDHFLASFNPTSWTPPLSSILQTRLPLISELKNHENPAIADWAFHAEMAFEKQIRLEREREEEREKHRQESYGFE